MTALHDFLPDPLRGKSEVAWRQGFLLSQLSILAGIHPSLVQGAQEEKTDLRACGLEGGDRTPLLSQIFTW